MMLLMIFFLNLELACKFNYIMIIFIAKSVFFLVNVLEFSPGGTLFCPNKGELNIIVVLPVVFLSVAVVINLRNWIYYYIKIGEMAYKNEQT